MTGDSDAMKRAVAFCQVIEVSKGAKTHKVSSKQISGMFQAVVEAYQASEDVGWDSSRYIRLHPESARTPAGKPDLQDADYRVEKMKYGKFSSRTPSPQPSPGARGTITGAAK